MFVALALSFWITYSPNTIEAAQYAKLQCHTPMAHIEMDPFGGDFWYAVCGSWERHYYDCEQY